MSALSKEELRKIVEDPYVDYLLRQRLQSYIRNVALVLGPVAAIAVVVLGLVAGKAKEWAEQVESQRTAIISKVEEAQRAAEEAEQDAMAVQDLRKELETLRSDAIRGVRDLSSEVNRQMQETLTSTQASATKAEATLEMGSLRLETLTSATNAVLAGANNARAEADKFRDLAQRSAEQVNVRTTQLLSDAEKLKSLDQINREFLRNRGTAIVILRERSDYHVELPDIAKAQRASASVDDPLWASTLPELKLHFRTEGISEGSFTIRYSVDSSEWNEWVIPGRSLRSTRLQHRLGRSPYTAVLEQVYWGFFSPELVVFRIVPADETRPEQVSR